MSMTSSDSDKTRRKRNVLPARKENATQPKRRFYNENGLWTSMTTIKEMERYLPEPRHGVPTHGSCSHLSTSSLEVKTPSWKARAGIRISNSRFRRAVRR
jgi:hypothetical protein